MADLREIIFDTETTGLSPENGDRVIEIGALELINRFPTGRTYHVYLNPEGRAVHPDAEAIHGISNAELEDKPTFADELDRFLEFFKNAKLVAHNASFDMKFLNAELKRQSREPLEAARVVDTLAMARLKHPMGPNSLDALCSRYGIDNSHRTKHGALLDSELLAEVYIELLGGRQTRMDLAHSPSNASFQGRNGQNKNGQGKNVMGDLGPPKRKEPLPNRLSAEDIAKHRAFIATLAGDIIWKRFDPEISDSTD